MIRVKLTYPVSEFVLRQTPDSSGVWEDFAFSTDVSGGAFDGWVVYDALPSPCSILCDPQRTIFITGEPSSVREYDGRFLRQFAAVISPHQGLEHPRVFRQQPAIPWWVGIAIDHQPAKQSSSWQLNYDQLKSLSPAPKAKLLSVICSNKALTSGHRDRLQFLNRLIDHFGSDLDVFGHGFRPVTDKWDAIHPYRYHIVLENVRADHYWTEKIADTFLAGAFPLYCGCPNLGDYFPEGSFRAINRNNPAAAIAAITDSISKNIYDKSLPILAEARALVLDKHNLFPVIVAAMRRLPSSSHRKLLLRPECDYTDTLSRILRRQLRRTIFGR